MDEPEVVHFHTTAALPVYVDPEGSNNPTPPCVPRPRLHLGDVASVNIASVNNPSVKNGGMHEASPGRHGL